LVKVDNGGVGGVIQLDPSAMLSAVRNTLENSAPPLMTTAQSFMISGAPLLPDNEVNTPLSAALDTSGGGIPVLTVATAKVTLPNNENWTNLTVSQQLAFLNNVAEITRGLTIDDPTGGNSANNAQMHKTTFNAMSPIQAAAMTSEVPRIDSSVTTNSYFSEFAESMATSSSNSVSLSVSTPYGGGSTSFEHAKSETSSSSAVTTYSVGTYNVNIAVVDLDQDQLSLTPDFTNALLAAAELTGAQNQFVAIVEALNKYGWYLPTRFVVGGVLYTTKQSECQTWSDVQSTTTSFGASFQASFDGIGGGAAYNNADTSSTTTGGETGSSSLSFTAIGGTAATANDFPKWSASLENANNWDIASYEGMIPSIYPLHNMGNSNNQLLTYINNCISNQYSSCPELYSLQPKIDCGEYSLSVKKMLPQFG
jgi:hypothetical protein